MGQFVSTDKLLQALKPLREGASPSVIVTTNGCFDILHVGHLRYLKAAKALGDILVVALNSDRSVKGLKGPQRPIVSEADRAELLAGLTCVDYVVLFEEATPENLFQTIQPNIHVKGAQYNVASLPEADMLKAMGTKIEFIPMIEGRSSTQVIDKIKQLEGHATA